MKNNLLLFIISLSFCACTTSIAEKSKNMVTEESSVLHTIPFVLTDHNNISIEAVINQRDTLNLMFHTAAGTVDLIESATKKIGTLNWGSESESNSWGGSGTTRSSENNTLEIHDLKWDSLTIWETRHSGPYTDGKFGPNLFADKFLEINFDNSEMLIHEALPSYSEDYIKIPISTEGGMMFIEGLSTIEESEYANRFLIHSGYKGTILYDDDFVADSKIGERIKINSQKELKDSQGNILITKNGELPSFRLGDTDFRNMPVGFFDGAIGRQKMSVLGGDLLRRFNIIFDSKREFIYLKPNQLSELPFSVA